MAITLEGYIARRDGSVDFLFMLRDKAESMAQFSKTVDAVIMGRKHMKLPKLSEVASAGRWFTT